MKMETGYEVVGDVACRLCGNKLKGKLVYHNDFVPYVHCENCDYDWQLWKLGSQLESDEQLIEKISKHLK